MTLTADGNFGVNTENFTYELNVNGPTRCDTALIGRGGNDNKDYMMLLHEGLKNTLANGLRGDYALCQTSWGITYLNCRSGYYVETRVNNIKQTKIQRLADNESLNIIKQLNPCKYEYIDKQDRGSHTVIGLIVQDVEKVSPQAIKL